MLPRVSRIQLSTLFSSTFRQGFSSVPQVLPKRDSQLHNITSLTQKKFSSLAINFDKQTDGKMIVIVAPAQVKSRIKLSQIMTAAFAFCTAYTIFSNLSYVLTATFALGTIAIINRVNQTKIRSDINRVLSIQIDQEKRIYIDYTSKEKLHNPTTAIVDKKNFMYNAIRSESSSQNLIWIKANNEWFALPKQGLTINNQQFHNLL